MRSKLKLSALLLMFMSGVAYTAESGDFDAARQYQTTCFACHGTGAAHSPEVGDVIEWEIRLEKGIDTLVQSTINGLNGIMPPRGLCADCTDAQLKAVVEYMLEESKY